MSIELTKEQQEALDSEQGIPSVIDPRTQESFVLLRTEIYERIRGLLDQDDNVEDAFQAQIESAAAAGWDDPALDVYNELDPRKHS